MGIILDTVIQTVKKHSPEILVGAGIIGVIAGTVVACKETKKVDAVLDNHTKRMEEIHMASDTGVSVNPETKEAVQYTEKDKKRDTTLAYGKTAYELVKLYLPSGLIISASVACILGSHSIMTKRNTGLTAAYVGISQAFEEYRQRIAERYGREADIEARYGTKAKKGKNVEGEEPVYEKVTDIPRTDHSRFFMEDSNYFDKNKNINLVNLIQAERTLNRKLKTRRSHMVTLNEVYDALDLEPAKDGQVLGYIYHPGVDELDEYGNPQVIKFLYIVFDDVKKKNVKKTLDEAISENGCGPEPVMLIDFPNLVPLY